MQEVYKQLGLDTMNEKGGNNSDIGRNIDQYLNHLPEKAVKKGDKFTIEIAASDYVSIASKNTYTVKEISADKVVLDIRSDFKPGDKKENKGSVDNIKGEQTGTVEIDRKTGLTTRSETKQNIDMEINSVGMKMPMKITGTTVFTCEKK